MLTGKYPMNKYHRLGVLVPLFLLAACQQVPQQQAVAAPAAQQPAATQNVAMPTLEFRLAQTQPGNGLSELRLGNQAWHYQPAPALTRADLYSATPMRSRAGTPFVNFKLTPQGAQKLAAISQRFSGQWLAFSIDGQLVSLLRLSGQQTDGVLNVDMTSEAQAIAVVKATAWQSASVAGQQ